MNKNSPLKAYMVVGHLSWMVISPLILFIGGGNWLIRRFDWDSRLMIVFVFLGLITMICGFASYVRYLLRTYGESPDKQDKSEQIKPDKKDYDY
jgi:4-amino-4-deoxy-L-arabinose transferase-like glycosyltransferase